MLEVITPPRGKDTWGSGDFGASRGSRLHMGVDYEAPAGATLLSPVHGIVTKHGYPYGDDLAYRYIQVLDPDGNRHRFYYVTPTAELREAVCEGDPLGTVQNIVRRYPTPKGMKNHVHYEIIDADGNYKSPEGE
ncbi:hypothetical protein CMI47_04520 [Candidatus Pacearchaeota archaeon]|nr:hypothetical protein [Candidatus Pacearchaeota archaeon]